jgi:hypothetical protein
VHFHPKKALGDQHVNVTKHSRRSLIDERELFRALQKAAARRPLLDTQVSGGIRRAKRARVSRR